MGKEDEGVAKPPEVVGHTDEVASAAGIWIRASHATSGAQPESDRVGVRVMNSTELNLCVKIGSAVYTGTPHYRLE